MKFQTLTLALALSLYAMPALGADATEESGVNLPTVKSYLQDYDTAEKNTSKVSKSVPTYSMRSGDQLEIIVYGHDDISTSSQTGAYGMVANNYSASGRNVYIVRPDGKLDFPLIGEVDVDGKSVTDVREELTARLAEYIKNPRVSVNISRWGTTRVYVLGEVKNPGLYELDKSRRVLDAIGKAGAYTKDAAKRKVFLIHQDHQGAPINIDLIKMLREGDMSQNYELREGDVLYLNDNGRIDFARDILPFISAIYMGSNIKNNK